MDEDYARPTNFDPDDRADHMTLVLEPAPRTGPALGPNRGVHFVQQKLADSGIARLG